jgi:hypothetical protein
VCPARREKHTESTALARPSIRNERMSRREPLSAKVSRLTLGPVMRTPAHEHTLHAHEHTLWRTQPLKCACTSLWQAAMEYKLQCPACGSPLAVELLDEITMVACVCGEVFAAQHPDVSWGKKPKKKTQKKAEGNATQLPALSLELLEAADDVTSAAVIAAFAKSAEFKSFAKSEMKGIMARDAEDDEKVRLGAHTPIPRPFCRMRLQMALGVRICSSCCLN